MHMFVFGVNFGLMLTFAATPVAPPAPAPAQEPVVVESGSGTALPQSGPMVVKPDGDMTENALVDVGPVACAKRAMRIFGGDRKQAIHLCKGGTGSMERVHCAEQLVRYFAGNYDDVATACMDGGTTATAQCVMDAAHLFQGSYNAAIALCAHGGSNDNYQCARQGLVALGGFTDDVVDLCRNIRPLPR